jgi:hypothetical protein
MTIYLVIYSSRAPFSPDLFPSPTGEGSGVRVSSATRALIRSGLAVVEGRASFRTPYGRPPSPEGKGKRELLRPAPELPPGKSFDHRHAVGAVVEARDRGEALSARLAEIPGVFDADFLQRLQAVRGETGR